MEENSEHSELNTEPEHERGALSENALRNHSRPRGERTAPIGDFGEFADALGAFA